MRVCLITESIQGVGGAEAVVRMLATGLARRGHEVLVISLDSDASEPGSESAPYEWIALRSLPTDRYGRRSGRGRLYSGFWLALCFLNRRLLRQLERCIEAFGPDVVHTHKIRGFPRKLWSSVKTNRGITLVHTCHDIELLSPLHTIRTADASPLARIVLRRWSSMYRAMSRTVDKVTSPSLFMLNLHLEAGLFSPARATVVGNFPSLPEGFTPRPLGARDKPHPVKLAFLGRLVEVKGVVALCQALVEANRDEARFQLRVAGDGPLREVIERFGEQYEFIEYMGVVRGQDKADLLHWSEVVATPSQYDETFCIVAAEAISAGRPVLAGTRGALAEVVAEGVTGWIFQGEGKEALVAGLERVHAERSRLAEFSARCLFEAKRFEKEHLLTRYEQVYGQGAGG